MESKLEKLKTLFAHQAISDGLSITSKDTNKLAEIAFSLFDEANKDSLTGGEDRSLSPREILYKFCADKILNDGESLYYLGGQNKEIIKAIEFAQAQQGREKE